MYINKIQRDATVCRYLFTAKLLCMYQKLQLQFDVLLMMDAIDNRNI